MMFGIDWQVAVSLVIVSLAIIYLIVRLLGLKLKRGKNCGGCHSCSKNSSSGLKVRQIVQIGKPPAAESKHAE